MAEIYLVAGATGKLGQEIVSRLLLKNRHVRAFVRDATKGRALLGENLEVVEGDIRRIDTIHEVLQGVHTVICATGAREPEGQNGPEEVEYEGVRLMATVAANSGVARFVLVSALGVAQAENAPDHLTQALEWKRKGEEALRESGVAYLIVRPGRLTEEAGGQQGIKLGSSIAISGEISRADLAEVILQALARENISNVTFEVVGTQGPAPQSDEDWNRIFAP